MQLSSMKGAIFDLDGVIVDTARYHYLAWKWLAGMLGFEFEAKDNERLKGVSRVASLEILLEVGGISLPEAEKLVCAERKNARYLEYIAQLTTSDLLPGARGYLLQLRSQGVGIALGSASKNAAFILDRLGIADLFDAVVDGNKVAKAKPDPEVFIRAGRELGLRAEDCVVFEDAAAGIEAAIAAKMWVVGIGNQTILHKADQVVSGLYELLRRS
jgi:beta-phosphoglucomutase